MPNHVSPSQLFAFTACAKAWEWRYVHRRRSRPGVAAVLGKGGHAAAETTLTRKLEKKPLPTEEEVSDTAADAVRAEWEAEPPMLDEEERQIGEDRVRAQTIDGAVAAAGTYLKALAPSIEPIAIEAKFEISVPGLPTIVGYKDVETADLIRDLKTGKKQKTQKDADSSAQLTLYALEAHLSGRPKGVALDSIGLGARGAKAATFTSTRDDVDFGRVLDRLSTMDRMVRAGLFPPADPSSWKCGPKYCEYWDECPHGGRRQVLVQIRRAA